MTCESNDTVHLCVDVCVIYESLFFPQLTYSWWSIRKPSKILARYINWVDTLNLFKTFNRPPFPIPSKVGYCFTPCVVFWFFLIILLLIYHLYTSISLLCRSIWPVGCIYTQKCLNSLNPKHIFFFNLK